MADSIPALQTGRLRSIDFLRGIAAMAVVLYHAISYGTYGGPKGLGLLPEARWFQHIFWVLSHGDVGVPLFFVLSGFCIHARWARQKVKTGAEEVNWFDFWKRRIYRLYPAYIVALAASMALVLTAYLIGSQINTLSEYPPGSKGGWIVIDFLAHATMLHGFHPTLWKTGGNAVYWTLAIEEYLYALYFGLLLWRRRLGVGSAVAMVLVLGLMVSTWGWIRLQPHEGNRWYAWVESSAVVLWIQWCLGMVAAEAYYGLIRLPKWCYSGSMSLLLALMAAFVRQLGEPDSAVLESLTRIVGPHGAAIAAPLVLLAPVLWGLSFFTLMNCCIRLEVAGRWSDRAVVQWLTRVGLFSYSLYLVHLPVRSGMKYLLGQFGATSDPWRYLGVASLMAMAGYAAGRIFFHLVERHFVLPPSARREEGREAPARSRSQGGMDPGSSALEARAVKAQGL